MGKRYEKNPDQVVVVLFNHEAGNNSRSLRLHITPTRATFVSRIPVTWSHAATWTEWTRVSTQTILTLAFPNGKLDMRVGTRAPRRRFRLGWATATHQPAMAVQLLGTMIGETTRRDDPAVFNRVQLNTFQWFHTLLLRGANAAGIELPERFLKPPGENEDDYERRERLEFLMTRLAYPGLTSLLEAGYHFGGMRGGMKYGCNSSLLGPFRQNSIPEVAKAALGNRGKKTVRLLGESLIWNGSDACLTRAQSSGSWHSPGYGDPFADEAWDDDIPQAREAPYYQQLNLWNMQLAMLVKGILPLDDLQAILAWRASKGFHRHTLGTDTRAMAQIRRLLKGYSRVRVKQWIWHLLESDNTDWQELQDAAYMWSEYPAMGYPEARTLTQLHAAVTRGFNQRQRLRLVERSELGELKPFDHKPSVVPFNGQLIETQNGRYTFLLPQDDVTLLNWGEEASNCIGSYGPHLRSHKSVLAGFRDESGNLEYCLEISLNGEIRQWVGKHNRIPEFKDHVFELYQWLNRHGIADKLPYDMDPNNPWTEA